MKKPRGEAILKNLPDKLQAELWEKARGTTYAKALAWLAESHDVHVSEATLSIWFRWYPRSLTLRTAASMAEQLEDALRKLPQIQMTADQARKVAQVNFELVAARDQDPALFSALRKDERDTERLRLEREKFTWEKKTDVEKVLDAVQAEIGSDKIALDLFTQLQARLLKLQEAKG